MTSNKDRDLKLIRNLRPEVEKFHPWLMKLVEALPDIHNCHYTHGIGEFGADIICEQVDSAIDTLRTIAIVVKVGKLKQDGVKDVESQIDECFCINRDFPSEVRNKPVGSVWVVTTDNITHGAQRKIAEKFKGRSISFIDHNMLAKLARKHAPHLLDNISPAVSSRMATIRENILLESQRYSLLPSNDSIPYIHQKLTSVKSGYTADHHSSVQSIGIDELLESRGSQVVAIEGEHGSGKSTLMRRSIEKLCTTEAYLHRPQLPVRIDLAKVGMRLEEIKAFVDKELSTYDHTKELGKPRAVLFIDSLEQFIPNARARRQWLAELNDDLSTFPTATTLAIAFTSPLGPVSTEPLNKVRRLRLNEPTVSEIISFIKRSCGELTLSARIFSDIRSSPLFKEIRSQPAAAVLLADLLRSNNKADLPTHLTELYSKYAELVLGRWLPEGGVESAQYYKTAQGLLSSIAFELTSSGKQEFSMEAFGEFVSEYLLERNSEIESGAVIGWIEKSNLIHIDKSESTVYFRNRLLREYFSAKYLQTNPHKVDLDRDLLNHERAPSWFFFFGLRLDCPYELRSAVNIKCNDSDEKLLKMLTIPQLLLAANQTSYDISRNALMSELRGAAELYIGARDSGGDGVIDGYSEMDLLWWFQNVLRAQYGMNYFLRAVEHWLDFPSLGTKTEVDTYAGFFLAVIAIDLGVDDPFRSILDTESPVIELPTPLLLAIRHEAKGKYAKVASVKRVLKRIGRIKNVEFSNNSPFSELYATPLSKRRDLKATHPPSES